MKNIFILIICGFVLFLTAGCQNTQSRAGEGAILGGILGGAAGGIIGHQSHHGGEGAAIGVAAGAITGAIVGSQVPKQQQAAPAIAAPAPVSQATQTMQSANPNQMSIQQIVDLTKQGVNEDVIVDKIRLTDSRFSLAADDIDALTQQGVSQKVIGAMQGN